MKTPMPAPIPSPCKKICAVDGQTGLCLGCGRSLREIGKWTTFTPDERDEVMAELDARMDKLKSLGKLG